MTRKTAVLALTLALTSAAVAAPFRPIVDVESGYFMGASDGKKWLDAKTAAPLMKSKTAYNFLNLRGKIGAATGDKPKSLGAPCPDTLFVEIKPKKGEIAVGGGGNFSPRTPQILSNSSPIYRRIVADILRKHGLKPVVKITKILRVDLEGDGTSEVLISATNHKGYDGDPGSVSSRSLKNEYSMLLLRKIVGGKVITQMLDEEYFVKDMDFNAPDVFTIAGAWDLNGDGKLEIVTRGRYYEGDGTTVYEMRGAKAVSVLDAACGS